MHSYVIGSSLSAASICKHQSSARGTSPKFQVVYRSGAWKKWVLENKCCYCCTTILITGFITINYGSELDSSLPS